MADPKYANLPGIDRDQPDVFETSELPEDDQAQMESEEPESEAIEKLAVNAGEAFSHFKGKTLDSSNADFSERLSKTRRTGYAVPQTEYELIGDSEPKAKETPQQKFQRLQHEIRELTEEVNQIQESMKADSSTEKTSPVPVARQMEYLQKQLTDLHLDKLLGKPSELSLVDPQGALQKRLITELSAFKPDPDKPETEKSTAPSNGDKDHVTYQLYYRPEQAKFSHNARMADIEQRVERMEALVGHNPERLSTLTAETNNKSLMGAVAVLSGKLKLLDPAQLEQVEGRIAALGQKMNQLSDKKEGVESADKNSQVSELYDLVKKWDTMADSLPHVVERLTALKELHEQALQFSQSLAHLDTAQQQISSHLDAHGDMLTQVKNTLSENMSGLKGNMENIDTRMKALDK